MSVASHLSVSPRDYDARIRGLIPYYDELITGTASAVRLAERPVRQIVDVGTGTGALARACLTAHARARLWGIDADPGMLRIARERLARMRRRVTLVEGDFLRAELPRCDAIVASFALHHIRRRPAKLAFYQRCRTALRPGGILVTGDCAPARLDRAATDDLEGWLAHLARTTGSRAAARKMYESWAAEDTYFPLSIEAGLLERAGFAVDVRWRRAPFAVIAALRRP